MGDSSSQLRTAQGRAKKVAASPVRGASDPTAELADAGQKLAFGTEGQPGGAAEPQSPGHDGSAVTVAVAPTTVDQRVSGDDRTVISSTPPELRHGGTQSSAELGRLLTGEQLDHFILEEYVGGGGMGAVFRATDTLLGRQVAVKVLSRDHAVDEETTRRFRNEAQSAARLDHATIARVYFVGVDRGWHYIVLEYVEGQNVRDLVAIQGPLPLASALDITLQVAEALEHASGRNVVHRDIKPSNVLVTRDGHVKLVDMGLARLRQVEQSVDDITATGVTLGTFDYISPEQARDPRAADVRSDLYSLGCTMYYMLCGRPPFPEGTVLQKLLQHQGDEAPDCRQLRPEIPDGVAAIVRKLLAKNPQDRYQQPRELIGDVLLVCEQLGVALSRSRTAIYLPAVEEQGQWARRHLPWIVPLCLLIIAVLGIQLYGVKGRDLPPPQRTTPVAPDARAAAAPGDVQNRKTNNPAPSASTKDLARATPAYREGPKSAKPPGPADASEPRAAGSLAADGTDRKTPSADVGPIVSVSPAGRRSHATLAEACRQAPSGSIVELRYNGRREELPLQVSNRELTVRAAEGFRPIVVFRPQSSDPLVYGRNMVSVLGGGLTLVNVELELQIPPQIRAGGWSLVESVLADKVRLERCTLTVQSSAEDRLAHAQDVSFFLVHSAPRTDAGMLSDAPPQGRTSVELRNCVVRGEATLLSGDALHGVSLQWENGLLSTSQSLVELSGADQAVTATGPLQIELQHVTALMRQGMCRIDTRDDRRFLPLVRIHCTDCILMTEGTPLIEQRGDDLAEDQQKTLLWKGNHNFYEGIDVFWRIDGRRTAGPTELDWAAWRDHWGAGRESAERGSSVAFVRLPDPKSSPATHTPTDFVLDESEMYNPALGTATDGTSDVGLQSGPLPTPSSAAAAKLPKRDSKPRSSVGSQDAESAPLRKIPELKATEPAEE